ncbi:hypothetical protein CB1_000103025 [Camelus ferus]|nr:hypothetical protein CB1_000103025 [Camelus ferus]
MEELEAYAGVISALRAQGDLTKEKKDLLGELSKVLSMSGPNSSSEWSIEGRRLVPLMPRLVPQTAFTVTANAVANAAIQHNASLPVPAETGSKEGVSCSDEDEKPRKRRRTNSSSSSPVVLKEVPKAVVPVSKTITVPTTNTTTQKSSLVSSSSSGSSSSTPSPIPNTVAVTAVVSSTPSVVMSTVAQGVSTSAIKMASTRLPSPKSLVGAPTQILAQFPKQHQQSPKQQLHQVQPQTQQQVAQPSPVSHQPQPQQSPLPPGIKPTIQIKQESGVKIITQQVQPSKILPKPVTATLPTSSNSPIMVVSSNGAIMTTKLVTTPTGTQATYTRPTMSPSIGRMAATPGAATYVKTTSGSIITVVPKSLATLGGKIISSNIVSGTTTKITTIPMTSKPNVIVVQKTTGKGTTIQGLPGKNVVTTLLNAGQGKTQVLIKPKPVTFQATVVSEQTRQLVTETLQQASRVAEAESSQSSQVKEKLECKPRQPTIDLSQMAVPIQMTQEKRHSPESPSIAVVESELVAEYITTERTDEGTEVAFPLLVSHRSQPQQPSQPQRTLLQHVAQSQTATQTSVVVKSIPASSPGAITHIMQQALSSHTAFTKHSEELGTEEGEVEEMDTLDPQTGLFYRSALTQSQSAKQQKLSQPQLEQTQLQVKTLQCFQTKQKQTIHLQADQLQHKLPQMPQLSIRHQKLTPLQQEQAQPKPDAQHTQHPMAARDRPLPTLMAQPPQTVVQVLAVKTTQQLPKLQQAPNQPKIYVQPQTPQGQMPLPASSEKQPASQASEKTAVSDILKMSLMEAQIDTNVEHIVVDPPKKALATSMLTGVPTTGQFMRIQNVGQKKAEESPAEIIIQAIPQYAIPCHSSSNVVVEPSGLLELNNFTSQQLDDDETAVEQDIDSSTEDGTEPSPSQSSAERS